MYDAIIIGAGSGGYSCAVRAAQQGGKVLVVEKDKIGGCCTHRGCIPTKALLKTAKLFHDIKNAARLGIKLENPQIDKEAVFKRMDRVVSTTGKGIEQLLKSYGVETVNGNAVITGPDKVKVGNDEFETKNIVIATGSEPRNIPGLEPDGFIMNSDTFFDIKQIPESIVIVGGGAIGVEFANILAFCGSNVTVVEMMDHLAPAEDVDISIELEKIFKRYGIKIYTRASVNIIGNKVCVNTVDNKITLEPEKVLVAIGRKPVMNEDELKSVGISYGRQGINVNDRMQTNIENIYAIGDVTGKYLLAHVAMRQGVVAAQNITGMDTTMSYDAVPGCIYSKPEIASIGMRGRDDDSLKVGKFPFIASGKARTDEEKEGFVKVLSKDNRIVGVHIIGGTATELVGEAGLIINSKFNLEQITGSIHPHPTFSESIINAIEDVNNRAIDLPWKRD